RMWLILPALVHALVTKELKHLGWIINLKMTTLRLPEMKRREFTVRLRNFLRRHTASPRSVAGVLRTIAHMDAGVRYALQMAASLQVEFNRHLSQMRSYSAIMTPSAQAREDILEVLEHLLKWDGKSFLRGTADLVQHMDASGHGWVAMCH